MGPGWPATWLAWGRQLKWPLAGLHPRLSPGVSAFSRYLVQGKTRTGNHVVMETREALLHTGENKHSGWT